jgi:hypothetical protein
MDKLGASPATLPCMCQFAYHLDEFLLFWSVEFGTPQKIAFIMGM